VTKLQNTILEMIAKGEPLSDTVTRLCLEVERIVPDAICSVLRIDAAGLIRPLAAPSLPAEYSDALDGLAIGPDVGACGTAAFLGHEIVAHDVEMDPRWREFTDLVLPLGLKACWSSPIFGDHPRPIATFAFYYREKRGPSAVERKIVEQSVHLCAIALDRDRRALEYERRASTDALTGLPNRACLDKRLAETVAQQAEHGGYLLMLDLDGFKAVNDTFGHAAGDDVLRVIADRLRQITPPGGFAARLGGDEFVLLLTGRQDCLRIESIVSAMLSTLRHAVERDGRRRSVSATVGGALLDARTGSAAELLRQADLALYDAKRARRGTGRIFGSPRILIAPGETHAAA
jgi:diguanylate cyclase (GGDEF)-like protein